MFFTKNKFFDKHHNTQKLFIGLMEKTILFEKTTERWAKKRKSLSSAFYKQKLVKMTESIKRITLEHMKLWKEKGQIDLISAINEIQTDIILECGFGKKH